MKNTFCCYNFQDVYHSQSFFLVFVTWKSVLSSRTSVSKRSQNLGLQPRTCTTFSHHSIPALKNWKKQATQTCKNFLQLKVSKSRKKNWNSQFFQKKPRKKYEKRIILRALRVFFQVLHSFFWKIDNFKNCFWYLVTFTS